MAMPRVHGDKFPEFSGAIFSRECANVIRELAADRKAKQQM